MDLLMMAVDTENCNKNNLVEEDFLEYALTHGFGDLHMKVDPETGLKAIVAIHNTKLGPALGGCRFIEYPNTMAAIKDAMRLAKGMSYKAAAVNLPLGGGKSVIIKPKTTFNRDAYFHMFGRFVNELNGRYITALDSGTTLEDMDIIGQHTPFVASKRTQGNPSPCTAQGVFYGIQSAVNFVRGTTSLEGIHIAIQGLGEVGFRLAEHLHRQGAILTVSDINPKSVQRAVEQFDAKTASTADIHKVKCDVFSPCALGAIINDNTLPEFQCDIIAGAANNQLAHAYHGQELQNRNILYAPDYVINAGGLIFAAHKYLNDDDSQLDHEIERISTSLDKIFELSKTSHQSPETVADMMVEEKLAS